MTIPDEIRQKAISIGLSDSKNSEVFILQDQNGNYAFDGHPGGLPLTVYTEFYHDECGLEIIEIVDLSTLTNEERLLAELQQ